VKISRNELSAHAVVVALLSACATSPDEGMVGLESKSNALITFTQPITKTTTTTTVALAYCEKPSKTPPDDLQYNKGYPQERVRCSANTYATNCKASARSISEVAVTSENVMAFAEAQPVELTEDANKNECGKQYPLKANRVAQERDKASASATADTGSQTFSVVAAVPGTPYFLHYALQMARTVGGTGGGEGELTQYFNIDGREYTCSQWNKERGDVCNSLRESSPPEDCPIHNATGEKPIGETFTLAASADAWGEVDSMQGVGAAIGRTAALVGIAFWVTDGAGKRMQVAHRTGKADSDAVRCGGLSADDRDNMQMPSATDTDNAVPTSEPRGTDYSEASATFFCDRLCVPRTTQSAVPCESLYPEKEVNLACML
jgi:hypothetical protein